MDFVTWIQDKANIDFVTRLRQDPKYLDMLEALADSGRSAPMLDPKAEHALYRCGQNDGHARIMLFLNHPTDFVLTRTPEPGAPSVKEILVEGGYTEEQAARMMEQGTLED